MKKLLRTMFVALALVSLCTALAGCGNVSFSDVYNDTQMVLAGIQKGCGIQHLGLCVGPVR